MNTVLHSPDCIYTGQAERCDGSCRDSERAS
jgi:hypothetical protein